MNAIIASNWTWHDTLGVYLREAGFQFLTILRTPGFALPTLLFPTVFYLFFGLLFGKSGDNQVATFMLATYGTFGIMAPALFGFGVGVAMERERGILAMKRVAPMPPMAYLFAKAAMAMPFALVIVLILFVLGAVFGGVRLPRGEWWLLAVTLVVGTLPFCALGLLVGVRVNGQASAAIVNLIYLPMSFLAGLWVPLQFLPHWLQAFAVTLPTYHLSQLALGIIHANARSSAATHILYLAVFTAVCLAFAVRGWRRIQDR
ncbi:MAG: Efflux ABC transporter, permease protein [Rhodanobacteraceae bacterium]|jgi:ABC-2 type transport system permease protein|nr:MAG: Efflux ABC transporter, permease protein [Rhodanobacteraceae bacterium]